MRKKNRSTEKKAPVPGNPEVNTRSGLPGIMVRWCSRYDFIILFIVLYLAYNTIDGVGLTSGDTAPASLLPVALLEHHTVYLDFATSFISNPDFSYAFSLVNGHYLSLFPIVTPVLVTPLYALSGFLSMFISNPYGNIGFFILSKSAAAFIAALAGVFIYLSGKELFEKRIAILTVFIFAFATTTWSISSQALWQQGTVELLLAALIYLIIRNEKHASPVWIVLIGILSGLFVFNRPPDALLLIPILFYIVWRERSTIHYFLAGGIFGGLPFFCYNYFLFGNIFGGYKEDLSLFTLNTGFAGHFLGLLLSPNGGLFIFCPVLLLSAAGFYVIWRKPGSPIRSLLLVSGLAVLLECLLYSIWNTLSASIGYCYGPRYMTGLVPVLCIYTGYFLDDWFGTNKTSHRGPERWIAFAFVAILLIASLSIQVIGVFFYGYSSDSNLTMDDTRAWNITDSLIVRSYTEGSGKIPGISIYILPPLSPVFSYNFPNGVSGG
jgi:hypothetical protein